MIGESDGVAVVAPPRDRLGLEVSAVLAVTYGASGIRSLLDLIHNQLYLQRGFGLNNVATGPLVSSPTPTFQWFDITVLVTDVVLGLAPAFLAVVLLLRTPGGPGLGIGLDRFGARDLAQGVGFAALIGIPGIGLVYIARELGLNAQITVTDLPDVWYRIPVLLLDAVQNGVAEEIVVTGYLLTRLSQIGWSAPRAIAGAAVVRGGYHLYQGYGAFLGNAIMGVIFGWWFQRTKRVLPLVVAHALIDAVSFVGYVYLHGKVDWL